MRGSRRAIASRLRQRPWPENRFLRRKIRSADGVAAAAALSGAIPWLRPADGRGAHTDYGNLTLLATDDVGGLEVRTRAGQWIEAPVIPGAFIVNIGDCLMRWTNDVYVSTPHRVVNRSAKERYSIAFFYDPNPDATVETIPSCVGEGEVVRYPPILAADYLTMRLDASKPAVADRVGV